MLQINKVIQIFYIYINLSKHTQIIQKKLEFIVQPRRLNVSRKDVIVNIFTVCAASALGCSSTGNSCVTKPASCSSFTTASDCNNLLLAGAMKIKQQFQTSVSCGWDATKASSNCVTLTCELLPASLTTDSQYAAKLTQGTCTTSGAGCVTTIDVCSNYKTQTICQDAKSKDTQGSCAWENSSCRPIKCEDKTVGATDDVCSTYLTGCRTNGVGCVTPAALTCSGLARLVCQKDGSGNPCYWFSGSCQSYIACTSLVFTSHSTCQSYSTSCTTDGTKCIATDKCASLQKPSCFVGTDNGGSICGWGQTTGQTTSQCQVFSNCGAFSGTTNVDCASWGSKCITDGTKCIDTANCASYLTQNACGNQGLDGRCQWVAVTSSGTNSTNSTNSTSSTSPTTYSSICRLKVFTDLSLTSSSSCSVAISKVDCVSDGTKCIPKSTCSSYTTREACAGKGTDGVCAFTPANSTTPTVGTCKIFSQCSDANSDSLACNSNPSCNFVTNGTQTTCSTHTCATKAQGSTCYPFVSSFADLSTYQICVLSGTSCVAGNANTFTSSLCYDKSVNTYTWNPTSQTCQACNQTITNNTGNNNNTNNSNNTYGYLLSILVLAAFMF